jgi:hypothetical protein
MLDQPRLPAAQRTNPERSFKEEVRALRLGEGESLSKTLASIAATTTTLRHAAE